MHKKYLLIFIFILLLSAFVRIYKLGDIPSGFNYDEAMVSYNAYTLSHWGKDQLGNSWPLLYINCMENVRHQVLFFYEEIPAQLIFGVNKFSSRITPALFGVISVFLTYLFTKKLFSPQIAILSAILVAISPWHIWESRSGYEIMIAQAFFLLGLVAFFSGNKGLKIIILTLFCFLISGLTYRSYMIFLPPLILSYIYLFRHKIINKKHLLFTFILSILFTALCFILVIIDPRKSSTLFIYDEYNLKNIVSIIISFIKNYLFHYSFLANFAPTGFDPKYWMASRGLYYLVEFPLIILGLVQIIKSQKQLLKIILPWLILYPLAHSLTDLSSANRMFVIMPLPQILAGAGIYYLAKLKKLYIIPIIIIYIFSFLRFNLDYFLYYPPFFGPFNHEGPEYVYNYTLGIQKRYKRIIISRWNTHPVFFLYFSKYPLPQLLADSRKYTYLDNAHVYAKINNIYFVDKYSKVKIRENDLVIDDPQAFPEKIKPLKTIYLLNGNIFASVIEGEKIIKQYNLAAQAGN